MAEGQQVRLLGVAGSGTLLRIKDQGRRAEVQMGPKRVEVDMEALEVLSAERTKHTETPRIGGIRVFRAESEHLQQRLHLVGLKVDEAIPLLDKATCKTCGGKRFSCRETKCRGHRGNSGGTKGLVKCFVK